MLSTNNKIKLLRNCWEIRKNAHMAVDHRFRINAHTVVNGLICLHGRQVIREKSVDHNRQFLSVFNSPI